MTDQESHSYDKYGFEYDSRNDLLEYVYIRKVGISSPHLYTINGYAVLTFTEEQLKDGTAEALMCFESSKIDALKRNFYGGPLATECEV